MHWRYHKYFDDEILALPRLAEVWGPIVEQKNIFKIAFPENPFPKSPGKVFLYAEEMVLVVPLPNVLSFRSAYGFFTEGVGDMCCEDLEGKLTATQVLKGSVMAYKIGFTHDPPNRMQGYLKDGFHRMHLLYIAVHSTICKCLEAHLIRLYRGQEGCHNESLGGEGPDDFEGPYFVYMAIKLV